MSIYGYRVHFLEPRLQRSQDFLSIEDVSAASNHTDAVDAVQTQLEDLQGKTHVGVPTYFQDVQTDELRDAKNATAEDLPYFTVLKVNRTGRRLDVLVETGREQDHDGLRDRSGAETSLKQKAAVRRSWIILLFPKKGDRAMMISQVRGRTYSGDDLFVYLTRMAQRENASVNEKGNRIEDPWLNWKLTPCIDGNRLDGIMRESSEHAFRLRRRSVGADGQRGSVDLELVQFGLKRTTPQRFLDVLVSMAQRRNKGTETDRRAQAAADVLTLVEPTVGGVDFTDAELQFSENGKKQRVTSETVDQLFVYPMGSRRPEVSDLLRSSARVVNRIAKAARVEVLLPDK